MSRSPYSVKRMRLSNHGLSLALLVCFAFLILGPLIPYAHAATYTTGGTGDYTPAPNYATAYAANQYWVFYGVATGNSNLYYVCSSSGTSGWSAPAYVGSTGANGAPFVSLFISGTTAYLLWDQGSTTQFSYRYGTLGSSCAITWSISVTNVTKAGFAGGRYGVVSFIVASNGSYWAAMDSTNPVTGYADVEVWLHSSSGWHSKGDTSSPTLQGEANAPRIMQLANGDITLIFNDGNTGDSTAHQECLEQWTGSGWSAPVCDGTPTNPLYIGISYVGDTVYATYSAYGGYGVNFISWTSGGASWSSSVDISGGYSQTEAGGIEQIDNGSVNYGIAAFFTSAGSGGEYSTSSHNFASWSTPAAFNTTGVNVPKAAFASNGPTLFAVWTDTIGFLTSPLPDISITVTTSPADLLNGFYVNGTVYSSPLTITGLVAGVGHYNITAASIAGGANAYKFSSWSDSGARSHIIAVPASSTTYTATFVADSGGTIADCTGPTPFIQLQQGCWLPAVLNWYSEIPGLALVLGILLADVDMALFIKTRSAIIAVLFFTVGVSVLGAAVPGIFAEIAYVVLALGIAGMAYYAYTLRK